MKKRIKSYKFWVSLSASVIILIKALGNAFGFEINPDVIDGIIMGFCGVLVVFGFVDKPEDEEKNDENDREIKE